MFIAGDRWTCPACDRTIAVLRSCSETERRAELVERQRMHALAHALADADLLRRLGDQ